jgi:PmbA protein
MTFDDAQRQALAEQLLESAIKAGAEAAEVFQSQSLARPVFFEANRLKQLESSQSEGTALRLWKNGRPGIAVAYGMVDPQALVARAIALSELNETETIELADQPRIRYPDLGESVNVETLVEWGKEAIALVREQYPETLCSAEWDCETELTHMTNSAGLDCGYLDTTLSCYLSAEWVRGDDFLNVADGQTLRDRLDPQELAQQLLQRLAWAEQNVSAPNGRVPILFTSKAADMLWATVQAAMNGKRVIERASPWSDRLGEPVMSSVINLSQQPEEGPFSCPFDDEGSPTQPINFIKNGELQLFYTDRTIGRALGSGTTGNGFRPGLGSYPTPGLFNFMVEPGFQSLEDLIAQMDDGLIVDQILGGGAGISGEFSINVDLGYRVQNGQITGRVKDTMVAGSVYTALKNVIALGSDADWNGSCYTPSILVEGPSTTGRSL